MAAVRIRRLVVGDEQVLAALAREAPDFDLAGQSQPDPPLAQAAAREYLATPGVLHWVAEAGERVVGELLCHVLPLPFAPGPELLLYSIGVREGWRRQGVGSALMGALAAWQREQGIETVWVLAGNPGARAFYTSHGFGPDPDEPDVTYLLRRGLLG